MSPPPLIDQVKAPDPSPPESMESEEAEASFFPPSLQAEPKKAANPAAEEAALVPSRSQSMMKIINGSHSFVINGYSFAKGMGVENDISSDTFKFGGFKWAIIFYPDGEDPEDKSRYVSIFVLKLLDQGGNGRHKMINHFEPSLNCTPFLLTQRDNMWGYKRFFLRTDLESSHYLKDDCLKINCTMGVVVHVLDSPRSKHSIFVPESDIGKYFGALLNQKESADVVFDVAGDKFYAHRLILATRASIFHTQFLDPANDEKKEILVVDLEPKVFEAMLHFVYLDTLLEDDLMEPDTHVLDTLAAKVLDAAYKYDLGRLRVLCEARLRKHISVDKVASVLELAYGYHATMLKDICLIFIVTNLTDGLRSSEYEHIKENYPLLHLELQQLHIGYQGEHADDDKKCSACDHLRDGGGF